MSATLEIAPPNRLGNISTLLLSASLMPRLFKTGQFSENNGLAERHTDRPEISESANGSGSPPPSKPASPDWIGEIQKLQADADIASSEGSYEQAERCYKQALRRLAELTTADEDTLTTRLCVLNNYALLLKRFDRFDDAEKQMTTAIQLLESKLKPGSPFGGQLYSNLGRLYRCADRLPQAIQALGRARDWLSQVPDAQIERAECELNLGLALAMQGDTIGACQSFEQTVKHVSSAPQNRDNLKRLHLDATVCYGSALMELNRFSEAEISLRNGLTLNGGLRQPVAGLEAAVWNMLGFIHARCNQVLESIHAYRAALRVHSEAYLPDQMGLAEAHFNLATLYSLKECPTEFQYHLSRAATLIDEQGILSRSRDGHFREIYFRHFSPEGQHLSSRDLSRVLMVYSLGGCC